MRKTLPSNEEKSPSISIISSSSSSSSGVVLVVAEEVVVMVVVVVAIVASTATGDAFATAATSTIATVPSLLQLQLLPP